MKKAFTVIEILIAMMILFTAIAFVNISIKAFNNYQRKSEIYQKFYITALSLKDWISMQSLDKEKYNGEMNGIRYKIWIKKIVEKNNYIYNFDTPSGNYGDFLITLYKIRLLLEEEQREKEYSFFLTKQKRVVPLVDIDGIEN